MKFPRGAIVLVQPGTVDFFHKGTRIYYPEAMKGKMLYYGTLNDAKKFYEVFRKHNVRIELRVIDKIDYTHK